VAWVEGGGGWKGKPAGVAMPRAAGGGRAMICASLISSRRFWDSARMRGSESPDFTRCSKGLSLEKITPELLELVSVAPEKPEKAAVPYKPGDSRSIISERWTAAWGSSGQAPSGSENRGLADAWLDYRR